MLPEGKWNDVNEPDPGSLIAAVVQSRWLGLAGATWFAGEIEAVKCSDTVIGTLHTGWYRLVQTKAASTAAPARGIPCFYDAAGATNPGIQNSLVTPDTSAAIEGNYAGVYVSAPTKGNWCVIQVSGLMTCKYRATVTDKTIGNLVILVTNTLTFDALGDAGTINTAGGAAGVKNVIGTAYDTPTDAGLKLVMAWARNMLST